MKSLNEMEELKRFQGSTFDECSRRRLIENQDTILELTARIEELQNEVNCLNDSRDFKDAESVLSGRSHVTSQPVLFSPFRDPGGRLSRSLGMPSRNNGPTSFLVTRMEYRETFLQSSKTISRQTFGGTTTSKYRQTHTIFWNPSSPWSGKSPEDNRAIL